MRYAWKQPLLLTLGLLALSLSKLQAQDPIDLQITGPTFFFGGCETWSVENSNPGTGIIQWGYSFSPSQPPTSWEVTNEPEYVLCLEGICEPFFIWVQILNPDGTIYGEGNYLVDAIFIETFMAGNITLQSDCAVDSFFVQENLYITTDCPKFCVGETYVMDYFLDVFSTDGSSGGFIEVQVTGGVVDQTGGPNSSQGTAAFVFAESGQQEIIILGFGFNDCGSAAEVRICADVSAPPIAEFNTEPPATDGVLTVCNGQIISFESIEQDADSYLWDFGDGSFSSEPNPSHTYADPGNYQVTLTVTNGCTCIAESSLNVQVTENDTPLVDCVGTVCAGESVTYTSQSMCGSYLWTVSGNGTLIGGGGTADDFVTVRWNDGPIGTVTLDVADCPDLGTCTEPASLQVPIIDDNAVITGPTQPCRGEIAVYEITAFAGTSYQWDVSPFGTILSGQGSSSIQVEWFDGNLPPSAQFVSVSYDNCYLGCSGSDQLTVNISPDFRVEGDLEVCPDGQGSYGVISNQTNLGFPAQWTVFDETGNAVFTAPGPSNVVTIDWNFGSGRFDVVAQPADPTVFCVETVSYSVLVFDPSPPIVNVDGQRNICQGNSYAYEVTDINIGDRFRWEVTQGGATNTVFGNPIVVVWDQAGPYGLEVVRIQNSPNDCESDPLAITIEPITNFTIVGNTDACLDQLNDYSSSEVGDLQYDWQIIPATAGTITGATNDANIEILWHQAGMHTLQLDICGQITTEMVTVHAPPTPVVIAPADLCPNETAQVSTTVMYDSYSWQDSIGMEVSNAATPNLGPGYYRLEVTDNFGCVGKTTFFIFGHPAAEITISTPDPNVYCNPISIATTLYATATTDAFSYQWLRNGNPIGTDDPIFTATQTGSYRVEVTDENGCVFSSNAIPVIENCNGGGGPGDGCPAGATIDFFITPQAECNLRFYTAGGNFIPGTLNWLIDDPYGPGSESGNNITYDYRQPGFYRVLAFADFPDGMGGTAQCGIVKVDTVKMTADFEFTGACAGSPISFFDLSTFLPITSIADWSWDFGDPASGAANTSSDKDPMHTFTGGGDFTVTLTVTATDGCTATYSQVLTIFPQPAVNFEEPLVNCEGTALEFIADVASTVTDVVWDFGDPASGDANGSELFTSYHAYDSPGNYTITLDVTSIFGCTNSFSRTITVTPNTLVGDISPPGPSDICEGDSIVLMAPAIGVAYEWSTGETTADITVKEAGVYTLTVTDAEGCTYEPNEAVVNVIPAPVIPIRAEERNESGQTIGYTYESLTICEGEPVYLETTESANFTYFWSSFDFDSDAEFSEDRGNLLTAGNYEVSVTVTDNTTGCVNTSVFAIEVLPLPQAFTISGSSPTACAGTSVTISIDNPEPGVTYIWSNGQQGTSITVMEAGDYTAIAVSPNGCSIDTDDVYTVWPGADISLVPDGCHQRCTPDTLCVPTIPGAVSYQWYLDGSPIPGPDGTIANLIANSSGSYNVEITDVNGCVNTSPPLTLDLFDGFGTILGEVYFDVDMDGVISAADTLVPGIGISIASNTTTFTDMTQSTSSGAYGFVGIPADMYRLDVIASTLPTDWLAYQMVVDTVITGCDEEIVINWLLYLDCGDNTNTESFTICDGEVLSYRGENYTYDTTFVFNTAASLNCDSTITFSLTVFETDETSLSLNSCDGAGAIFDGINIAAGASASFVYQNGNGCDSTLTVTVIDNTSTTELVNLSACSGESVTYQGDQIMAGSQRVYNLVNEQGCDSTLTVAVAELPIYTSAETLNTCGGQAVVYNGQTLAAGSITDITYISDQGCDSTITVTVQDFPILSETLNFDACVGESIIYEGDMIMAGSQASYTYTSSDGCDSMVTVVVAELPDYNEAFVFETCPGEPIDFAGQSLMPGSTTNFNLTTENGCDSNLTVQVNAYVVDQTAAVLTAVCPGDNFSYNGMELPTGTDQSFILQSVNGCDSAVQVTVLEATAPSFDYLTDPSCADFGTGQLTVNINSGTVINYSLDGGAPQTSGTFDNVTAGEHDLAITYMNPLTVGVTSCEVESQIQVDAEPPLLVNVPNFEIDCVNRSLDLGVSILSGDDGLLSYEWGDGSTTENFTASTPGIYGLTVSNACETMELDLEVISNRENDGVLESLYIPNAFSPNGDGVNDFFEPYSALGTGLLEAELLIFDRWGNLICQEDGIDVRWNGESQGKQLKSGVYIWRLTATVDNCGVIEQQERFGDVVLIR